MQEPRSTVRGNDWPDDADPTAIEPEAVRAQLEHILASPAFDAAERNRRFLRYVVEEALAGRSDRIKAYSIAVEVFGRDDSFDPQSDPIVRIEASRLRRSLDHYHLLAGRGDPIRIEIPKGGYVPVFHRQGAGATLPPPEPPAAPAERPGVPPPSLPRWLRWQRLSGRALLAGLALLGAIALTSAIGVLWLGPSASPSIEAGQVAASRHGPAILVVLFDHEGGEPAHPDLSRGFTREVIAGLTRFSDLFVFGPETAFRHGAAGDILAVAAELGVDFVLSGGVSASPDHFQVTATLVDGQSGQYLWSGRFDSRLAAAEIIRVRDDLADQVVRVLAQPYGVVFTEKVKEIEGKPPQSLTSYECVLKFFQYWKNFDTSLYGPVRECLERAIVADSTYADAFASLAIVYADGDRFNFGPETSGRDLLAQALELARRAVDLAPHATQGYHALHLVYWLMNDVERSFEVAERGLALNPNDTALMAELGLRYCLRAQWDRGLPLLQQSYARNPFQSGQYRVPLFLHHYINGRYEEALAEANKFEVASVIYAHMALAMAHAQLGQTEEANAAVDGILAMEPAYGEHIVEDLHKRNLHPELIEVVVDGLEAAGLKVREARRAGGPDLRPQPDQRTARGRTSAPDGRNLPQPTVTYSPTRPPSARTRGDATAPPRAAGGAHPGGGK